MPAGSRTTPFNAGLVASMLRAKVTRFKALILFKAIFMIDLFELARWSVSRLGQD
jgi:hypothetical protein